MRRALLTTLVVMILSNPLPAQGQPSPMASRIGLLVSGSPTTHKFLADVFGHALRELGYVEGHNVVLEYRWAEGKLERLPDLAAELVRLKVDAIVAGGIPAVSAAKQATATIPIVVWGAGDLVGTGLVASLVRPGGNITGSHDLSPELSGKRLELPTEAIPKFSRMAVLRSGDILGQTLEQIREIKAAARAVRVTHSAPGGSRS